MSVKEKILNDIIKVEGGFVDDPSDSGGATRYGITEAVARANGYKGSMRQLPKSLAFDIYSDIYWDSLGADAMPDAVAAEVVDTGVNMGAIRAGKFLQRALNVLTQEDDLVVDGHVGPKTLEVLHDYAEDRGTDVLVKVLNCLQGHFYVHLAEKRRKDEKFIHGWFAHRVEL